MSFCGVSISFQCRTECELHFESSPRMDHGYSSPAQAWFTSYSQCYSTRCATTRNTRCQFRHLLPCRDRYRAVSAPPFRSDFHHFPSGCQMRGDWSVGPGIRASVATSLPSRLLLESHYISGPMAWLCPSDAADDNLSL